MLHFYFHVEMLVGDASVFRNRKKTKQKRVDRLFEQFSEKTVTKMVDEFLLYYLDNKCSVKKDGPGTSSVEYV